MSTAAPRLTGRPSRFRGKVRTRPVVISLTPEGHAALAAGLASTGASRSDYIEALLRRAAERIDVRGAHEKKSAAHALSS